MNPNVHSSTIYNSQDMEATQVSINRLRCGIYIYTVEYYSAIKENEILPFAGTWMDLETTMLSEISQRKTNTVYHIWNLKNNTNECIYKTETNRYREKTSGYQWGEGRREEQFRGMGSRDTN